MRQRLYSRLQQLEAESARLRSFRNSQDREASLERTKANIRWFIQMRGIQQEGMESLMDAFARALGIGNRELRAQLLGGVNPIKKWFTENGIYEEMERRKAAGTWPAAEGEAQENVRL